MEDRDLESTRRGYGAMEKLGGHVPLRAQLMDQKAHMEREITRINTLLELLDNNPAIEQFINLQRGYL